MNLLKQLLKRKPIDISTLPQAEPPHSQSVVVYFNRSLQDLDELHKLDLKLDKIISDAGVGEYDWHEVAMDLSHGSIFMYGPNAEALFNAAHPTLTETAFMQGAVAVLRFGSGLDAPAIEVKIQAVMKE